MSVLSVTRARTKNKKKSSHRDTMTAYQGGKKRMGKWISTLIKTHEYDLFHAREPRGAHGAIAYWEPFVGMCGVMRHTASAVPLQYKPRGASQAADNDDNVSDGKDTEGRKGRDGPTCTYSARVGSDANADVVCMWNALQAGWDPPTECDKKRYEELKAQPGPSAERGLIGHACAFGGTFFSTYKAHTNTSKRYTSCLAGSRGVLNVLPHVRDVQFHTAHFGDMHMPNEMLQRYISDGSCVVYCDPPYANSWKRSYGTSGASFDRDMFWDQLRHWSVAKHCPVLVSEQEAPDDFIAIYSKLVKRTVNAHLKSAGKITQECVFVHKSQVPSPCVLEHIRAVGP